MFLQNNFYFGTVPLKFRKHFVEDNCRKRWLHTNTDDFMTDIGKVLEAALSEEEISGVIINPWNRTLMLDKTLIRIVLGDVTQ